MVLCVVLIRLLDLAESDLNRVNSPVIEFQGALSSDFQSRILKERFCLCHLQQRFIVTVKERLCIVMPYEKPGFLLLGI